MDSLSPSPLQILLADDDQDDCSLFKDALDELPVLAELTFVHDGDQLMQLLNKLERFPNLIFLDLNMPRKNGLQTLKEIKGNERLKHLSVIMFSTSFQKNVVDVLYTHGAQFYIRKPNEFSELKHSIMEALTLSAELNYLQPSKEKFVLSHVLT